MILESGHDFGWIPWLAEKVGVHHVPIMIVNYFGAGMIFCILTVTALLVWRRIKRPENYLIPDATVTATGLFDVGVQWVGNLLEDVIGPGGRRHLPLIGTIFFYILVSNMLGLIPGFLPPTSDLNTNLGMALIIFFYYNYMGIRSHGLKAYMQHFMGPLLWMAPLFFVIEIISHCVRPLSLSIRLFGNMTADHAVLGVFTDMIPIGVPVIFLGLGLFVCCVQAFVFTLLSIVYIALAEAHVEEH